MWQNQHAISTPETLLYSHRDFSNLHEELEHDTFACAEQNLHKQPRGADFIFMNDFLRLWWSRRSLKTGKSGMNMFFRVKEWSGLLYSQVSNSGWLLENRIMIQNQSIGMWPRVDDLCHGKATNPPRYAQICTMYSNSEVGDNSKCSSWSLMINLWLRFLSLYIRTCQ